MGKIITQSCQECRDELGLDYEEVDLVSHVLFTSGWQRVQSFELGHVGEQHTFSCFIPGLPLEHSYMCGRVKAIQAVMIDETNR